MAMHKRSSRLKLTAAITAVAAAAGVTVLNSSFAGAAPAAPQGHVYGTDAKGAVAGSYIVMLDEKADKRDLAEEYGGKLRRNYSSAINGFSASGLSETEAKRLAADPSVAKVVQNKKFTINATQENPPSWGIDRIDQDGTAGDSKYTYPDSAGEGVTAYVIDTGVRISHKDFEGRAAHGFDAVDNDESADDGNGHGTHVAGTIAGAAHGVAKKAKIVAVRVLDDQGSGTTEGVVAGIDWVTKNHQGPSVANMSLGGGADEALDEAVRKSIASGVTYGVAAGNESSDAGQGSPSRVKEAITVASSTKDDAQSDFSNFGAVVDIYAPGSDITSSWNDSDEGTKTISGTSMATPHVVGAAALYLAGHKDATPEAVATALTGGAIPDKISNPGTGTPNKLLKVVE
ncbi:serine protease [Streptomyces agglomeratus]|uniref:Serine protease n=1 Tax=Streptomyces agglomeratus TaxID=285458 RepID=A0A1E5P4I9_9ACTN|nr:S8 family peptidase [Streptomyces agglomeratus]OEJ24470.1 serine protease [Streptomyces agglomeratus]OEJ41580.1 serine protease [Streptomyces agglomeratus]OEJ44042.1 serine protease [Streptomyces agglomeratus]OEJ54070.1 serine protease [Streptomyces agglomeratus]OEJ61442.1 serine protease [Streptomyces agglomeratus]